MVPLDCLVKGVFFFDCEALVALVAFSLLVRCGVLELLALRAWDSRPSVISLTLTLVPVLGVKAFFD